MNIPRVSRVRKQEHQHTESCTNWMAPLNAPSSLAQSPPQPGANSLVLPLYPRRRSLHQTAKATDLNSCSHPNWKKNPTKKTRKKKGGEVACRIEAKQKASWHVYWQFCSPNTDERARLCSLPFHTWGTRGRKTFIAVTHKVLFSSREVVNV